MKPLLLSALLFTSTTAQASVPRLVDALSSKDDFSAALDLFYAFNDAAAIEGFERAAALNADCVLCYWGVAQARLRQYLLTGAASDREAGRAALNAADEALGAYHPWAFNLERALVRVTHVLYEGDTNVRLRTYAAAMHSIHRNFSHHPDVGALYGLALLGQSPSCHWIGPHDLPDDAPVFAVLEHVLEIDPTHIGAHHFYIHARERSNHPELALHSARVLPLLSPDLGHMVHMPSHIHQRVGDYASAAQSNLDAIEVDDDYFEHASKDGVYYDLFYLHNHHFLWSAQVMQGERQAALETARKLQRLMSPRLQNYPVAHELFAACELLTDIRFADWDAALAAEAPDGAGPYVRTLEHLAHGLAALFKNDLQAADAALAAMRTLTHELAQTHTQRLGGMAQRYLTAEIARRRGAWATAEALYQEGIASEDTLPYAEPWLWQLPTRDAYARALLDRGAFNEALSVCESELALHPASPFAMALCDEAHTLAQ